VGDITSSGDKFQTTYKIFERLVRKNINVHTNKRYSIHFIKKHNIKLLSSYILTFHYTGFFSMFALFSLFLRIIYFFLDFESEFLFNKQFLNIKLL